MEQIFEYIRNFAGAYYAETIFVLALLFLFPLSWLFLMSDAQARSLESTIG